MESIQSYQQTHQDVNEVVLFNSVLTLNRFHICFPSLPNIDFDHASIYLDDA